MSESTIDFFGETFRLNPAEDYQWELLEFAEAADGGADTHALSGAAATMRVLKAVVHADDWGRFRATARKNKAVVGEHLMPIVVRAFRERIDRPTGLPSGSSGGQQTTPPSSEVVAYSQVVEREEAAGRPDRALMVLLAQEHASAT